MDPQVLHDVTADEARDAIAGVGSPAVLEELREAEASHPEHEGGRTTVLRALDRRRAELEGRDVTGVTMIRATGPVDLDARRRTSVHGGVYDVSDLDPDDRRRVLDEPGVTPVEVDATPAAVELAAEHAIDLNGVDGTGEDGRVLVADVEAAIQDEE